MRTNTTLKTKAMSLLLAIVMLLGMLPISAFAADTKPSYVVLGDSISTGYGLADKTTQGFAYMLANSGGYTLTNLAKDGNTAAGILAQLKNTEDTSVKTAVAGADLITITAGGNDLMAVLYQVIAEQYNGSQAGASDPITAAEVPGLLTGSDIMKKLTLMSIALDLLDKDTSSDSDIYLIDDSKFTAAVTVYIATLNQVTATILADNPDANILVATQYNPYVDFKEAEYVAFGTIDLNPIYAGMEAGVAVLNTAIKNNAATGKYIVADVKAAFDDYTGTGDLYNADPTGLNIDFHPTAAGHAIIADTFAAAVPISSPEVYVGGVGMADGTYLANGATATTTTAPASGGYAHYKDGTLTLNNYSYSGASEYGISSEGALNIVLQGENSIAPTADGSDGISVEADLTISGSGRLDITLTHHGIYLSAIDSADITINGGTLNITAEHCIVNDYGSINFNGGTTTVDASGIWGSTAVFANGNITLGDGMEILQPTGAGIGTEEFGGKVISDSNGDTDIYVVIGASGTTPTPSAAEIYVGGVEMADGTYLANGATATTTTAPASGGYAHYKDGTLTLNNYSYSGAGYLYDSDDYYTSVIYAPVELAIVLQGENSITNTENYCDGITLESGATISGSGSIDINAAYGIYSDDGDITIDSGTLNITAQRGISGVTGSVNFNGGMTVIDARGGKHTVSATGGIIFKNGIEILEPSGAEIETVEDEPEVICNSDGDKNIYIVIGASGTTPPPPSELPIYVGGVAMTDGTYLANGATATTTTAPESGGYAYYKDGTLTLNNYEYEGTGYSYEGYTSVIYSPNALAIVLQGENTIINTEDHSDGITLESGATISGNGSIDITSYYGIYVWDDDLKIDSGSIDITAKSGIVCDHGSIYFNGGTTTIDATEGYHTVSATGGITFKDGIEILEPSGTEIVTDEYDYKVICDSDDNSNIKVVIGTKSAAPETLTGTVTITGDMQVGSTLTATVTDTNNTGTLSYQWYRYVESNTAIAGATNSTYTLTAEDITYGIFCVVSSSVQTGSIQEYASGTVTKKEIGISWGDTSFTYNGSAQKPTATATGTLNNDNITLTVEVNKDSVNAGDYTATVTGITGENAGIYRLPSNVTKTFTIGKANQNKPTVGKTDETVSNKKDGTISDVDTTMEYRKESETTYTAINGDTVSNLAPGKYYVRLKGDSNHNPSDDTEVTIAEGRKLTVKIPTAAEQIGYTLTVNETQLDWQGESVLEYRLLEGYSETDNFAIKVNGDKIELTDGKYYLNDVETDIEITVEGVADTTLPKAEISVSTNKWTEFLNDITFGLFFKETQNVTITATDKGSGVDKIYYLISDDKFTEEAVEALVNDFWTEYDAANKPSISPDRECIVYVKVIDKAQNVKYISSDGLVFDGTAPALVGIENGGIYYDDKIFKALDDNFLKIEVDGIDVTDTTQGDDEYKIVADNAEHTVTVTDKAGNKTEYKITVMKKYTVTFMVDGEVLTTKTVNHNADAEMPEIPAKTGYDQTAPVWDKDGKNITADTVINAVYTVNEYKITLIYPTFVREISVNHGMSFNEMYTDINANIDLAAEKDYYTFIGWYESTDGGKTLKETPYNFDAKVTDNITLYPKFEKNTYTVDIGECHYVGCTISGSGSYQHGETVTVTATPTDGTEFKYWLDADIAAGWEDDPSEEALRAAIVSYDETYTFTAEKDVSLEAVFSGSDEIGITAMLIAGTDEKSLLNAEQMDVEYDFGTVITGAEQIILPGEIIKDTVTIGDKHYRFAGFITFGYDDATETETAELKETLMIGKMPLYGSAEYWDWFNSISDGIYAAYMEYTSENDDGDDGDNPQNPNNPQNPTDPEKPDDPQTPSSPQTGDNSNMALWIALLFVSGGAVITLTVYDRKRRTANR